MRVALSVLVASAIAALLYLSLDSGMVAPPAERLFSLPLLGLAAIFGASAWAATMSRFPKRAPLLAGLSLGVGGYALLRLFL
jgi:hypothetical protein